MEKDMLKEAVRIKDHVTDIRRRIHQNPELGFKEFETSALIRRELEELGIEQVPIEVKTGVVGVIRGNSEGANRVIGLRAE